MPLDSLEFRASLKNLLVALIVILVPLTVFGFYVALQADNHVHQASGENFRSLTFTAAQSTSQFIADRVKDVSIVANDPGAVQAATLANRQYENLSEEAINAKVSALEQDWEAANADPLSAKILTSDLAHQLHRVRELNPALLKIMIADVIGSTVAATDRPAHYSLHDPDLWQQFAAGGRGAIRVSDLRYDDQNRLYYLSIAYPILQEGTGLFIGAVTATVDLSPLFVQFYGRQIGRTGRLFLVREDGSVIDGSGATPPTNIKSEEYAAIHDAMGSLRSRQTGYLYATLSNRRSYLIGFADTGLKQAYPTLPWIVVASQEGTEITGPMHYVIIFALLLMILAVLILSLLAAYVVLHTKQRLEDIETPLEEEEKEKEDVVAV